MLPEAPESFKSPVQWYPGHIAKWDRKLLETAKLVDIVVDVRDARLPATTTHPELSQRLHHKAQVIVLSKSALADPYRSKVWQQHWRDEQGLESVLLDSHSGHGMTELVQLLLQVGQPAMEAGRRKGLKDRPARVLVVGLPNVGKSSLINKLVGKKKAATGHKAGVTRQIQWVRVHPKIELVDSPGVIPPKLETANDAALLASVSALGDAAYDEQTVGTFMMERIEAEYPGLLAAHYQLPDQWLTPDPITGVPVNPLLTLATARSLLALGGKPDDVRAAQLLLKDFRQGRLGRLTLDPLPFVSPVPATEPL
jgi:ribosome biogenesis GTPase A